jgi:glycosyltransferase involved in cell wall biosynthesis
VTALRVAHLPAAVAGNAPALARAERALGLDSVSIAFEESDYDVDRLLAGTGRLRREVRRWSLLAELLRSFDVVHFNFGLPLTPLPYPRSVTGRSGPGSLLWQAYAMLTHHRELPLLRRRGKAIFVTYQGDDVRPASLADERIRSLYDPELDDRKREWAARFDRHAHGIFALNPDLLRALPARAEFVPYASVDLDEWRPVAARNEAPLVVHAPSDRRVKGTDVILAALDRLRAEGVAFELDLVEGVPRDEARRRYERADLLVDQMLLGWYGAAAVELMALGKPVVAYLRDDDLARVPAEMRAELPVIDASVDTLEDVLRELLTERVDELPELGRRSRAYVERWHDPRRIAERMRDAYVAALGR